MAGLTREAVEPRLRGRLGKPYTWLERCASTQREFAPDDAEGAVVATGEQTEGRGRLGRRWVSPAGTGLLFSVLLQPGVAPERLPELSVVAGEAVAEAIRAVTGLETSVKLPNDVLVGGRKVAGILAEAFDGRVVLGIGVNVGQRADELPADTPVPATSLRLETGRDADQAELLAEILLALELRYDAWVARTPAAK